jgi:hypothetical protein
MAKGSLPRSPRRLTVLARKASKLLLDSMTLRGFREMTQRVVFAFLAGGAIATAKLSCSSSSSLFSSSLTTVFLSLLRLSLLLLVHRLLMACALLRRRRLQSSRPLFLLRQRSSHCTHVFFDVVARRSLPSRRFPRSSVATQLPFFYCCIRVPLIRVGVHRGHDHNRRDRRHRRRHIINDTIDYHCVVRDPGAHVLHSLTCAPHASCRGCSQVVFLRDCADDRSRHV